MIIYPLTKRLLPKTLNKYVEGVGVIGHHKCHCVYLIFNFVYMIVIDKMFDRIVLVKTLKETLLYLLSINHFK